MTLEKLAKALYAYDWEYQTGNNRDGHWGYEEQWIRDYWLKMARIAVDKLEVKVVTV